jgi:hypothetical protein
MTKPERYKQVIAEGKIPINCAPDHGHDTKLIGCLDAQANVYFYCTHCSRDRKLPYARIKAIRDAYEREMAVGDDPVKQLMRDMSAWMSTVLPSYDTGNANYSMDVEETRDKLQARVKIVLNGGVA